MKSPSSKRMRVWRHNSFLGQVRMAQVNIRNMEKSDTLTPAAKFAAMQVLPMLAQLHTELKTRKD